MSNPSSHRPGPLPRALVLIGAVVLLAAALAGWKYTSIAEASAAAAHQPEPMEAISAATAVARPAVAARRQPRPVCTPAAAGAIVPGGRGQEMQG